MGKVYTVSKSSVANAYDQWKLRNKKKPKLDRSTKFETELASILRLVGHENERHIVPKNRQRWHEWRHDQATKVTVSLEFCTAIYQLTDVDISTDGAASYTEPTPIVTIVRKPEKNAPSASLQSNQPKNGEERFLVSLPRVAFRRSNALRVTRDWVGGAKTADPIDIGSVYYGVRQAKITLIATGGIEPKFGRLRPDEPVEKSRAEGVGFSDDPREPGTWTVNSIDGQMMDGSITLIEFAEAMHNPSADLIATVSAEPDSIDTEFNLSGKYSNSDTRKSQARSYLINKVIKIALTKDTSMFCLSRAKINLPI